MKNLSCLISHISGGLRGGEVELCFMILRDINMKIDKFVALKIKLFSIELSLKEVLPSVRMKGNLLGKSNI
jgi:hypothetical protein